MAQTLLIFVGALALALALARFRPEVRARLGSLRGWGALIGGSLVSSAASWFAASRDHAGTGFVTRHGWPKPFHFQWASWEDSSRSEGFSLLYFAGNSLVYAAALLILWLLLILISGARPAPPSRD